MLAAAHDQFGKGDLDAFVGHFAGTEQELQIVRATAEFLMAATKVPRSSHRGVWLMFGHNAVQRLATRQPSTMSAFRIWIPTTSTFFYPVRLSCGHGQRMGFRGTARTRIGGLTQGDWLERELRDTAYIDATENGAG